jgi:hypothetical protein
MPLIINNFWIGANILFNLETGLTNQVLLLVNREKDATIFNEQDANTYFNFVRSRATNIRWFVEKSIERADMFVIRGEQNA